MKLVRFGEPGQEKPGLLDQSGTIRDLSAIIPDIDGRTLAPDTIDKLKALDPSSLAAVPQGVRLAAPVGNVRNYMAIGLNYADHAAEAGLRVPREPVIFNKIGNCIVGPNDDIMMPRDAQKLDYEVEIGVVISKRARYVEEADAADYIAGYLCCNDVSERHFQTERSGQWVKGKAAETFGPLGPWLVTPDEAGDVENLAMWLDVNGERRQVGNTSTMIFKIPYILSYMTRFMVLEPGDVVATGTPPGVALGMKEPKWLQVGDIVTLGIEKLGQQRSKIVAFKM
ncbi:MAG: fumarylacetoacetate hydrolase family protein [Hyphomicrobiaceae bacterium]|nr:fumarylacetoacetate hydrolase family protein [Hyphomicrobiaceae bacterium]MCC0010972.1 fumarylacetoacetate hydrolase family protein [Hyphomicrobiaceae bacterium]